ncbi:MAG: hypothetical protein QW123_04570 [Desulfurococcaceae archaeon]
MRLPSGPTGVRHEEAVLAELKSLRELSKKFLKKYYGMFSYEAEALINKTLITFSIAREVSMKKL